MCIGSGLVWDCGRCWGELLKEFGQKMAFYFLADFSFEPKAKPFPVGDTASHSLPGVLSFSGSFTSLGWAMSKCLLGCSFWPQQYCVASVRAPHVQVESSWSPHLDLIPRSLRMLRCRFTLGPSARWKGNSCWQRREAMGTGNERSQIGRGAGFMKRAKFVMWEGDNLMWSLKRHCWYLLPLSSPGWASCHVF